MLRRPLRGLRCVLFAGFALGGACGNDSDLPSASDQAAANHTTPASTITNDPSAERNAASLVLATETLPVTVFSKPGFDLTLPDYKPDPIERKRRIRLFAARGEFEPVSIGVHARATVESLHADVTDLVGAAGRISRDAVDVRVVKVWEQAGLDIASGTSGPHAVDRHPVQVPELLVYDDSQEFRAGFAVPEDRLVDGHRGRALHVDGTFQLALPLAGLTPNRGTIAFWFRPRWDATVEESIHFLFNLRASETDEINLFYRGKDDGLFAVVDRGAQRYRSVSKRVGLRRMQWHRVVFTWDTSEPRGSRVACAVDGEWVLEQTAAFAAQSPPTHLYLGSQNGVRFPANGDFDELTLFRDAVSAEQLRADDLPAAGSLHHIAFDTRDEIASKASLFRMFTRPLPTLERPFHTRLAAGTSKQLWLTVHTPTDAAAGSYVGRVVLTAPGYAPLGVELELEVLDFELIASPKIHGIYFQQLTLDAEQSPHAMNEQQYVAALRDLKQHGLNSLRVDWISPEYFSRVLDLARAEGLAGIVVLEPPVHDEDLRAAVRLARDRGFEPYFYAVDECNSDERLAQQIKLSQRVHAAGARVTTALLKQTQDRLLDPDDSAYDLLDPESGRSFRSLGVTSEAVDLPIYHATYLPYSKAANHLRVDLQPDTPLHEYCRAVSANRTLKAPRPEMYYWPSWIQRPNVHRVLSGFFLASSGMDGAFPHAYMALGYPFNDVFDDYDNVGVGQRDMMTAYPSSEGPIPTTQWEALREGIDDLRYVATLERELRGLADDDDVRIRVSAGLDALLAEYIEPARFLDPAYSATYTPAKFNNDRERVVRWIQELRDHKSALH